MEEIWKDIKGYEGLYQVSNMGRVKAINKEKTLKLIKCTNGYLKIGLYKNRKPKTFLVHRLVAQAFIDNTKKYPCVNHKDENKTNNYANNLEWCSIKQNNSYGNRSNKAIKNTDYKKIAEKNKKVQGRSVLQIDKDTDEIINTFHSIAEAERKFSTAQGNICRCCNGKYKIAYGYKWRYAKDEIHSK